MKCTKTVASRAAPFGPDMHQMVSRLGLRPRPHCPRPPSSFRGWDPPGKGNRKGREREESGYVGLRPSTRDGKGGEGNRGKDGGGRVGKGRGRKGREGEEISIHGLKLLAPPMDGTPLSGNENAWLSPRHTPLPHMCYHVKFGSIWERWGPASLGWA